MRFYLCYTGHLVGLSDSLCLLVLRNLLELFQWWFFSPSTFYFSLSVFCYLDIGFSYFFSPIFIFTSWEFPSAWFSILPIIFLLCYHILSNQTFKILVFCMLVFIALIISFCCYFMDTVFSLNSQRFIKTFKRNLCLISASPKLALSFFVWVYLL